jgi:ribosomal protein S18 acetylase RimI-like enzyme
MKDIKFLHIDKTNISSMVQLLHSRQLKEIETHPYLETEKLQASSITALLEKTFNEHKIAGIGAYEEDELVGYLFAQIKFDETRGKHAWVPLEGMAIKQGKSSELIRTLYAEVSSLWLNYGCFTHYVLAPTGDIQFVDAFQRLSFGFEQVHGVLDISRFQKANQNEDILIRIGTEDDRELIGSMSDIIFSYQNDSPVYAISLPETVINIRKGYQGIANDEEAFLLLAELNGQTAGFQAYWPIESHLMVPERTFELSVAGTFPAFMGYGIGKSLMNKAVQLLEEKGVQYIITDWRITNLASSSFWPKCGFTPLYHRMQRTIDSRLGWANFNNELLK